ncbi:MAG: DMT family transporter [Candidatus Aenigmarchaeota archaeon]|nr:DMT family transporter [Candidatus Aenigmarchaeota archaeon]
METKQTGVLAVLLASMMWAIEPVFAKLSYENSDFLQTSAVRAIVVVLTALLYIFLRGKGNFRVTRKEVYPLAYIGLVGTVFADLIYFFALTSVPVVNAVLIGHMQPVFIILIAFFILKEDRLTKYDYLGILLMIISGLLVTTKTAENLAMLRFGTFGDLLVLAATAAWATTAIAMRKYLRNLDAGIITFYRFLVAAIVFVIYLTIISAIHIDNIYQILVGIVVGAGTILYYEGLKRIKAAQVSALELSAPFFAAVLALLILGEQVTLMQISGIFLLTAGVYFMSRKENAEGVAERGK